MITVIYSTHRTKEYNDKFNDHLILTSGLQEVQVLPYENHNEYSLAELYNKGIKDSKYDIVICCHNDIKLEKNWGKKLLEDFSNNPEFGLIGKAGSCYFPESGVYWEKMNQTMVGQVYHHPPNHNKWLSRYSPKLPILIPVVTLDGLFLSFDKTKIKHKFDESYGKFHFYDHGFCVPNYLDGVKLGVTSSFEITHESIGQPNEEFYQSKEMFLQKWGDKLPLDLKPENLFIPEIKRQTFKKFGKVAIIIPTKGKIEILFDCIKSYFDNCDMNIFEIFIADTGSTDEEKTQIKNFISEYNNINLIEFDYYNFAKINNEVVKNYLDNKHEFILFSNNDIKIMNDILSGMLQIFKENPRTGTVGCRLHFEDNTIQHDGIFVAKSKTNNLTLSHINFKNYYNYFNNTKEVIGNTGGLMLIRKNVFENIGLFSENYLSCFEDVDLNIKLVSINLKNYICGKCVAYHYESQTRKEDPENLDKQKIDYSKLVPVISNHWEKIKEKVFLI
jgi:GT2 family glycosyltransferase